MSVRAAKSTASARAAVTYSASRASELKRLISSSLLDILRSSVSKQQTQLKSLAVPFCVMMAYWFKSRLPLKRSSRLLTPSVMESSCKAVLQQCHLWPQPGTRELIWLSSAAAEYQIKCNEMLCCRWPLGTKLWVKQRGNSAWPVLMWTAQICRKRDIGQLLAAYRPGVAPCGAHAIALTSPCLHQDNPFAMAHAIFPPRHAVGEVLWGAQLNVGQGGRPGGVQHGG